MAISNTGVKWSGYQRVGMPELRADAAMRGRLLRTFRAATVERPGVFVPQVSSGCLDAPWGPSFVGGSGEVSIYRNQYESHPVPFSEDLWGMTADGHFFEYSPAADDEIVLTVPDDSTWRTFIVRPVMTTKEPGTIAVTNGSTTFVGTNTRFTETLVGKTTDGGPVGTLINLLSGGGDVEGVYEVDTVVSDTELTVTADAVPGADAAEISFHIHARYSASAAAPDYELNQRLSVEFELIDREVIPDPSDEYYYLFDCWYDGATLKFIDRRAYNLLTPTNYHQGKSTIGLQAEVYFETASPYTAALSSVRTLQVAAGGNINQIAITRGRYGTMLALYYDSATLGCNTFTPSAEAWAATGTVVALAGITGATIVQLPAATGYTHVALYTVGGILYMRRTTNDGVTWTATATVADPTGTAGDLLLEPAGIHLLNGRILVLLSWYDASDARYKLTQVWSDDYCETWDTGSGGHGTPVNESAGVDHRNPAISQSDNGTIAIAWQRNTSGGGTTYTVRVAFSIYDYKVQIGSFPATLFAGLSVCTDGTSQMDPAIWCDRDGNAICIYNTWVSGTRNDLKWSAISNQHDSASSAVYGPVVTASRRLARIENGAGVGATAEGSACAMAEAHGGYLQICYRNWADAGNDDALEMIANIVHAPTNLRWEG